MVDALAKKLVSLAPNNGEEIIRRKIALLGSLNELESRWGQEFSKFEAISYVAFHWAYGHFEHFANLQTSYSVSEVPDEQMSAKKLRYIKKHAENSVCMVADYSEEARASKLAKRLGLPLVRVNLLASRADKRSESFVMYFEAFANAFKRCFNS